MKKLAALILCLILACSFALTAQADEVVTIQFMNWGMAEDTTIPAFQAMIDAFNASHPNIHVESIAEAYNSYLDQTLILNASNEMPDCL